MSTYKAPIQDFKFVLYDVLHLDPALAQIGHDDVTSDLVDAVLEEAARFCEYVLAPLNAVGDSEGCTFVKESHDVKTPTGFKPAYAQYCENGWPSLVSPTEFGGQALPHTLGGVIKEMINAANLAWGNFPLLSHGATEALLHHGTSELQQLFLPKLVSGEWTGTMCLTEPQCGTDLGLIKTKSIPNADGSYSISGTKIFITAGEHDFTSNIIHLVLAKLPDAPEGSRGISLFIVPKFNLDSNGQIGTRNNVTCGAIEHKMGIHGSATCVMNFDGAQGFLVGQPNKGLLAMFTMMNAARLGVGIQGLGLSERATQNALRYARERLQMRAATGPALPDKPADPIIVHPDVRRMLLTNKALVEGSRVLAFRTGLLVDQAQKLQDPQAKADADSLLGFLTPIAKACITEWSIECTYNAMQCLGGHGYIAEHGLEQLARDARITTLYEGTTGIQALDLLGRKVLQLQGAGLQLLIKEILAFCTAKQDQASVAPLIKELVAKTKEWGQISQQIGERAKLDPNEVGAASFDYLMYSGYVVLAYNWVQSAVAAQNSTLLSDAAKRAKQQTAEFYFSRILPRTLAHVANIASGSAPLMSMADSDFDA